MPSWSWERDADVSGEDCEVLAAAFGLLMVWGNSWPGIGHVAAGMRRQGFDLPLTQYDERGWRATFYTTGMEHSPTSATGTAWERTPCHARLENLVAGSGLVFAYAPA